MAKKSIREYLADFCVLECRVDLAEKVRTRQQLSEYETNAIVALVKNLKNQLLIMIRELREWSRIVSKNPAEKSVCDEVSTHLDCLKVVANWLVMPELNVQKTLAT